MSSAKTVMYTSDFFLSFKYLSNRYLMHQIWCELFANLLSYSTIKNCTDTTPSVVSVQLIYTGMNQALKPLVYALN